MLAELIQEGFAWCADTLGTETAEADVREADIWTTGRSDASHRVDRPSGEDTLRCPALALGIPRKCPNAEPLALLPGTSG